MGAVPLAQLNKLTSAKEISEILAIVLNVLRGAWIALLWITVRFVSPSMPSMIRSVSLTVRLLPIAVLAGSICRQGQAMWNVLAAQAGTPSWQPTILACQYVEMAYLLLSRVAKITIPLMEMGVMNFASLSNTLTVMYLLRQIFLNAFSLTLIWLLFISLKMMMRILVLCFSKFLLKDWPCTTMLTGLPFSLSPPLEYQ